MAELLDDLRDEGLNLVFLGDIADTAIGSDAFGLIGVDTLLILFFAEIVEDNRRTLSRKGRCDSKTDAIACTGDPGNLSVKTEIKIRISF